MADQNPTSKYPPRTGKQRHGPSAVYLGDRETRIRREDQLNQIASGLGLNSRSEMFQDIADGWLEVRVRAVKPEKRLNEIAQQQGLADADELLRQIGAGEIKLTKTTQRKKG